MDSSANTFALLCATPLPSPSAGVMGWLQPGSGRGPIPCPVEAGRQFASPRPLLSLEDAPAAINNHCCLPGSSASSPCSLCSPGINRSLRHLVWAVTWDLRPPSAPLVWCRAQPRSRCLPSLGHRWSSTTRVWGLLWGWRHPQSLGLHKTRLFLCMGVLMLTHGAALCKRGKGALLLKKAVLWRLRRGKRIGWS